MSNDPIFTIISNGAPLVEVEGNGPTTDLAGGLYVPDGVLVSVPSGQLNSLVRRWRVDAPTQVHTTVSVPSSPIPNGAFVGVRRCVSPIRAANWNGFGPDRWPRLYATLKRIAPSAFALWNLLSDAEAPCQWRDIDTASSNQATARGGDLVVVTFVSP